MPVLYLVEQGASLRQEGQRLIVVKEDQKIADLPLIKLESILIYGSLQITTQAMRMLLQQGIQTSFMTLKGRIIGHLAPLKSRNAPLRMKQYARVHDPEWCLEAARSIVHAKLTNSRCVLERYLNNHPDEGISKTRRELGKWEDKINFKQTTRNLLGVEGSGTQRYYDAFRRTFRGELRFQGRNRRPPRDEVNALLSFGYTLVGNELTALIEARGLDPYLGIYHGIQYGRPSLALDALEPFRPAVDLFVMRLANLKVLGKADFEPREGGVYLKKAGLKTFFTQYEKWANTADQSGKPVRLWLREQVQSLVNLFQDGQPLKTYRLP